jgi:hypothetical protein
MRQPDLQKVIDRLESAGHQSPYLDRLRGRVDASRAQANLEAEIVQEMAEALGRTEDKLLLALVQLEVLERELAALEAQGAPARAALRQRIEAFNQQRELALRCRLDLIIHREALGFRHSDAVEAQYPIARRRTPPA